MDVDGFKAINDTYGHSVGDHALREMAAALQSALRPYDLCVRYAGDEFIVVLAGCSREAADAKTSRAAEPRRRDRARGPAGGKSCGWRASAGAAVFPRRRRDLRGAARRRRPAHVSRQGHPPRSHRAPAARPTWPPSWRQTPSNLPTPIRRRHSRSPPPSRRAPVVEPGRDRPPSLQRALRRRVAASDFATCRLRMSRVTDKQDPEVRVVDRRWWARGDRGRRRRRRCRAKAHLRRRPRAAGRRKDRAAADLSPPTSAAFPRRVRAGKRAGASRRGARRGACESARWSWTFSRCSTTSIAPSRPPQRPPDPHRC